MSSTSNTLTWDRVALIICARHPAAKRTEHGLRFVLGVGLGAGRTRVGMRLAPFDSYGHPSIEIIADVGHPSHIDPWDALRFSSLLGFGALAIASNVLLLRAMHPLTHTNERALLLTLRGVAAEATSIKQGLLSRTVSGAAFHHYAA